MRGLRKLENVKFNNFFKLVQREAQKRNALFFLDCGGGNLFENATFECENLYGWLIPKEQADEFEKLFIENSSRQHYFDDFYCSINFEVEKSKINIIIEENL